MAKRILFCVGQSRFNKINVLKEITQLRISLIINVSNMYFILDQMGLPLSQKIIKGSLKLNLAYSFGLYVRPSVPQF